MQESNIDFDAVVSRTDTDCLKFDFAVERGRPEGILPLWVADMDFPTSSLVVDALVERSRHGIFGYTEGKEEYFAAVAGWLANKHGWQVQPEWLVKTPGVVFALAMCVKAYTRPGDAVLIQQPVYYPFTEVIADNDRRVVSSDLRLTEAGRYEIDFADFEAKISENDVKLFLLCSPHNPVGRVWSAEELRRMGEICLRHGVVVVADEIHQDFVFAPHKHVVFAGLDPAFAEISVTCTSPGKTFNLAGLQISNIFIPNSELRAAFKHQVAAAGYSQVNTMGLTACVAAYAQGEAWYHAMMDYVQGNIHFMRDFLQERLPQLKMIEPEGTYLVWVDCRALGLEEEQLEELIVHKANLWLDSGAIFGEVGKGFQRFNVACPKSTLEQALCQLEAAVKGLEN